MAGRLKQAESLDGASFSGQDTIVFVMDMNNGFAKKGVLYSPRTEAMIEPIRELVMRCKSRGIEVIAFSDCHPADSQEFAGYPPHCVRGTEECRMVPELEKLCSEIIYKGSTNGIFCDLSAVFRKKYRRFIIVGCCTDICVYQFATSLKARFNEQNEAVDIIVPMDLVDTYDSPEHNADLHNVVFSNSMLQNGIHVVRTLNL